MKFDDDYLLIRDDIAQGIIDKVGHLHVNYNFYNWSSSWFGFVCKLQSSKLGYMKTEIQLRLRNIFKC